VSYVQVGLPQLLISLGLVAMALAISAQEKLGLERDLLVATLRSAIQLFAIGVVLTFLFQHERPGWVLALLGTMVVVAGWTAARRIEHGPGTAQLFPVATASVLIAGLVVLVPVFTFVIRPARWYEARLLVPISGMVLSSAMNGVALVLERIFASVHDDAPAG